MFIAHLPAGYCLTTLLLSRFVRSKNKRTYHCYLWNGLGASLLPDFDLIYFYLPCRYGWWVWNYILHRTFGLEIMIVVAAICLLYYKNNLKPRHRIHGGNCHYAGNRSDRGR